MFCYQKWFAIEWGHQLLLRMLLGSFNYVTSSLFYSIKGCGRNAESDAVAALTQDLSGQFFHSTHRVSVFDHPADRRLKSVHPFRKAANTTHVMARWPLSIKNNCRVISVLCIYGWTWKVYLLFILDTSISTISTNSFYLFTFCKATFLFLNQ